MGAEVSYRLVRSRIRTRATLISTTDPFEGDSSLIQDIHIEVVNQGDPTDERRALRTGRGTQDVSVTISADGRLESVKHLSVGAGPAVVTASAKLIGFIGGAVLSVVRRVGGLAGEEGDEGQDEEERPSPREKWSEVHPDLAQHLEKNKALSLSAANALVALREELLAAPDVAATRVLVARIAAVSSVLNATRTEIARIETLYATWLANQKQTRTASLACLVDFQQVPTRAVGAAVSDAPEAPEEGELGYELWRDFRLILQVVDARRENGARITDHPPFSDTEENKVVRWRVPRTVELWVWAQADPESDISLVTRAPVRVMDQKSDTDGMELTTSSFSEHGGSWTFGEDGSPSAITTNDKSMVGAVAAAFGSIPEQLTGAVDQAKKLTDSIDGIQDAAAEREKVAAERELATVKARMDVLGLNATEEDAAALARAEQAVKLRAANRSLSPAVTALDDLKAELDRATTQNELEAARQSAKLEGQLAEVKLEVARLEQEVLMAKANYDKQNPDKVEESG